MIVSPGEAHESQFLVDVLESVDLPDDAQGQPTKLAAKLAGDKAYRAEWIDDYLLQLAVQPIIPSKENEDRLARQVSFDKEGYRQRNIVERLIGWLKECRRILSRFEKTAINFVGMFRMAFIQRYLRTLRI